MLFAIFDPIGVLPIFFSLVGGAKEGDRRSIIRKSCLVSFGILIAFAYLGIYFFQLLGITIEDFKIVGGIILLIFAVEYVLGKRSYVGIKAEELAVFPLATPLLAGPGSISIVILLVNPPYGPITTLVVITLNVLLAWGILRFSGGLYRFLGDQGSMVISRIMGLIIGAVAIRLIREGVMAILAG